MSEKSGTRADKGKDLDITEIPNKYKIIVKGQDALGHSFLRNIQEIANMGGKIDTSHIIRNDFPHQCVMLLETFETVETDMRQGLEVIPSVVALSEEELKALKWEAFKEVCKVQFSITGRDRQKMTDEYLAKAKALSS